MDQFNGGGSPTVSGSLEPFHSDAHSDVIPTHGHLSFYAGVSVVEAPGHRFPKDTSMSPEDIAANRNKIMDSDGATPLENAGEAGIKRFAAE